MILFDYIVNLSIFSLLISTPLVIRSFMDHKPLKQSNLWIGLYGGIVSVILVMLSVKQQGYSYDIRYAPVILVFAYMGPVAGFITGIFALLIRLLSSGNWPPAIIGWALIMFVFTVMHIWIRNRMTPLKRSAAFLGTYLVLYVFILFTFRILVDKPIFHLQYVLFVLLGVIIGGLLIESHERLHRIIRERNNMEKTLEASESKYRLIANHTSDLIMVMDKDYSGSYFSPSHELVLGYQNHELKGRALCSIINPDDEVKFKSMIEKMFENKEINTSMEIRFKHKEGHWIAFESLCRPVKAESKGIEHIVMISRDISERKKAEEILLQSEKLSVIGELAAGVAHEIRNPLTTIKGFLQIYNKENHAVKYGDLLLDELERIETITSELLSMAKPQAVKLTRTDVKALIEYTVEFLTPQTNLINIELKRSYEETAFPIMCDKNQLKQVFLNILKNAIEAMPNGGEIYISLRKEADGECLIAVQDQGCGIPDELIHRLGQPFYSLKEKGTGLGLMICHKIIKQHHGSITYSSKVNEGTLIEIRLPLESTVG
ncbi:ATP-binding protein [Paenibacillus montanisoli]|uniref:histidine kinase n=1 Tax=Paenibacillus montanisoli TaxID=2081970 RepID=A0A328U5F1_9BACL|nr:ATP-binding protein [Paenibacillus montanisoli]RAP77302.1 PAS domain-containing sensor histidine kinase [Paenibacillus montanisoli]